MSESVYDAEVAPLLRQAMEICRAHDMALLAHCQWSADESGMSIQTPHNLWPAVRIIQYALRCHGNVDRLFLSIKNDANEHGHSSVVLTLMEPRP